MTDIDGTIREIASHSWDPYWLGTQITGRYWMDRATTMRILFCTYVKGRLTYLGTTLKMDLGKLFSTDAYYLARAKKVLVMAIHLGLVDIIQFQV